MFATRRSPQAACPSAASGPWLCSHFCYCAVKRQPTDWFVPRLYACGVLIGLAWWLWLTPSLVGWLIVIASVASALRSPWVASPLPVRSAAVPSSVTIRPLH